MSRMSKYIDLELFRDGSNDDMIDDLQAMTLCGFFDDEIDDDEDW